MFSLTEVSLLESVVPRWLNLFGHLVVLVVIAVSAGELTSLQVCLCYAFALLSCCCCQLCFVPLYRSPFRAMSWDMHRRVVYFKGDDGELHSVSEFSELYDSWFMLRIGYQLEAGTRVRYLYCFRDSLSSRDFRRLRVLVRYCPLKFSRQASSGNSPE